MDEKKQARRGGTSRRYASFDDYLGEMGVADEVRIAVEKRVIAEQFEAARIRIGLTKSELAKRVGTSRPQIDRVLDPQSQNVTIETLKKVAQAMGKRLHIELTD